MRFMLILAALTMGFTPAPASTPVNPGTPITQAPDTVPVALARSKFPKDIPGVIDALEYVNRKVNAAITYESDMEQYGIEDKWVTFPVSGKGDCEDYALTKMEILREAGYPAISRMRIRSVMVTDHGKDFGHAILEVRLPSDDVAFLDLNHDELMTRPELEALGYTFYDW